MVQLGEILKAYGHFQEAALHLRHVLELRPNHQPAALILKERITQPETSSGVFRNIIFARAGVISLKKEARLFGESGTRIKIKYLCLVMAINYKYFM